MFSVSRRALLFGGVATAAGVTYNHYRQYNQLNSKMKEVIDNIINEQTRLHYGSMSKNLVAVLCSPEQLTQELNNVDEECRKLFSLIVDLKKDYCECKENLQKNLFYSVLNPTYENYIFGKMGYATFFSDDDREGMRFDIGNWNSDIEFWYNGEFEFRDFDNDLSLLRSSERLLNNANDLSKQNCSRSAAAIFSDNLEKILYGNKNLSDNSIEKTELYEQFSEQKEKANLKLMNINRSLTAYIQHKKSDSESNMNIDAKQAMNDLRHDIDEAAVLIEAMLKNYNELNNNNTLAIKDLEHSMKRLEYFSEELPPSTEHYEQWKEIEAKCYSLRANVSALSRIKQIHNSYLNSLYTCGRILINMNDINAEEMKLASISQKE